MSSTSVRAGVIAAVGAITPRRTRSPLPLLQRGVHCPAASRALASRALHEACTPPPALCRAVCYRRITRQVAPSVKSNAGTPCRPAPIRTRALWRLQSPTARPPRRLRAQPKPGPRRGRRGGAARRWRRATWRAWPSVRSTLARPWRACSRACAARALPPRRTSPGRMSAHSARRARAAHCSAWRPAGCCILWRCFAAVHARPGGPCAWHTCVHGVDHCRADWHVRPVWACMRLRRP